MSLEHYRSLEVQLFRIRATNKGEDSEEEDLILDEMDKVWDGLTNIERIQFCRKIAQEEKEKTK